MYAKRLILFLLCLCFAFPVFAEPFSPVCISATVMRDDVEVANLSLEVVSKPADLQQGLMFREYLGDYNGMLFVFQNPQPLAMWMKNTYISLDILFLDAQQNITTIHRGAVPHDLTALPSNGDALYGLELAAGQVESLGIRRGDHIVFDMP